MIDLTKYLQIKENIIPFPFIIPHVFRHTFCTKMEVAAMDLKSLQYLIGHSYASVTLNTYAHNSFEKSAEFVAVGGVQSKKEKMRRFSGKNI